eukprot:UN31558
MIKKASASKNVLIIDKQDGLPPIRSETEISVAHGSGVQVTNENGAAMSPAIHAPAPPVQTYGPKPPPIPVLAVVPTQTKIKIYVEPCTEDVTYIVSVHTPNGDIEPLEFKSADELVVENVKPGRNYKVKVAAKSAGGVRGDWSESEPVLIPLTKETIVVLGGDVEYEENLDITEYYDDTDKKWVHDNNLDLTSERTRIGGCTWRGNLVVVGGSERGKGHSNTVEMYTVNQKRWTAFPSAKFVRHSHGIGVVDGKLFVLGGYGTRGTNNKRYRFLDVLEIYDSSERQWVVHPERMALPRKDFGCAVIDDEIFVAGGESNSRIIPDCEVFGFASGKWMKIASMNSKRRQCGACEFGGRFWVCGGFQGGSKKKSILTSVEMYDPHEDVWIEMPPLTEPRYGCALQRMNDKLFCIGGYDMKHDPLSTIEVFDFENNCWRRWKTRIMK